MAEAGIFQEDRIRGRFPEDFSENQAMALGGAVAVATGGGLWVVGRDKRLASRSLHWLIVRGLTQAGAEVLDLGQCGTSMLTFAVTSQKAAGGILVTGGEGDETCTGLRIWKKGAVSVRRENGLDAIRVTLHSGGGTPAGAAGHATKLDIHPEYLGDLMKYADELKPFSVMADLGCGVMGEFLPRLFEKLPCELMDLSDYKPADSSAEPKDCTSCCDGPAPDCFANPQRLSRAVRESIADLGIVFSADGSCGRLLTENGELIAFGAIGTLLLAYLADREPGASVVCDPANWRMLSREAARTGAKAHPVWSDSAIPAEMRSRNALLGIDDAGGYFFRDTFFTTNPELTLLSVLALLSREGGKLSELIRLRVSPSVRQTGFVAISDAETAIDRLLGAFAEGAEILRQEGVAIRHDSWSLVLRIPDGTGSSSLLVEAEARNLLEERWAEVLRVLNGEVLAT